MQIAVDTAFGLRDLLTILASGVIGALSALVAFRTRLALLERDMTEIGKNLTKATRAIENLEKRIDKRQILQLQMLANIAAKVGVEHRFDDILTRFLSDEYDP